MITKTPGASCRATITFLHSGGGGSFDVGIGLAPASTFGHNNVTDWYALATVIPNHSTPTNVTVVVNFLWPTGLADGNYDSLKFIQVAGGGRDPGGNGFLLANWDDDVYGQVAQANVFSNLQATYT